MQETQAWSLGWEDSLGKKMATHFSILVWEIPWTKGPGGLQSMGSQKAGQDWAAKELKASAVLSHPVRSCLSQQPQEMDIAILSKENWGPGLMAAESVKNLPAVWETWVWSLDWEEPLEKKMATHFSILAWRIPWTEEPGGLQSIGSQRVRHDWATNRLSDTPQGNWDPTSYMEQPKKKRLCWIMLRWTPVLWTF